MRAILLCELGPGCFRVLAAAMLLSAAINASAQEDIAPPDVQALINQATTEGKTQVVIPPGTYRISKPIALRNVQNLEILAKGVEILNTRVGETLTISGCANVKVIGLSIDHEPLPFTQGTITAIGQDRRTMEFELHEGYPLLGPEMLSTSARHFFDGKTRLWKKDANAFNRPKLEVVDGRRGRAVFDRPQNNVEIGDFVAFDRRRVDKSPCISIRSCPGTVVLEDITLYSAGGLAVVGRHCDEQVVFRRFKIERGPRPAGATQDRLLSVDADGINFAYCRKGPLLEDCEFSFMGDDAMNVHGMLLPILRVLSPTSVLVSRGKESDEFSRTIRNGDKIELLRPGTFERIGEAQCKSMTMLPDSKGISNTDVAKYFENLKNREGEPTVFQIDFSEPVDFLGVGQWLEFPDLNCPGFVVRNNYFHDHRARALRIMASDGLVEGNRIERTGAAAIQIGPELQYWREAGWVSNVTIKGNRFHDIGIGGEMVLDSTYALGVISVTARTDTSRPPYPREQDNIVIEGNEIAGSPGSGIHAFGARRISIRDNIISGTNTADSSTAGSKFQLSARLPIELEGVSDPVVENNKISR